MENGMDIKKPSLLQERAIIINDVIYATLAALLFLGYIVLGESI